MSQTDPIHSLSVPSPGTGTAVLVPPPDYVLVPVTGAIVILASVVIAALFGARQRRAAAAESFELLGKSAHLADQIGELSTALAATDARLAVLIGRLDEQSRTTQGAAPTSYNVAIRMARTGASRQELMATCGVTQQEADLVLRLHGADQNVRTAA